MHVTEAGVCCSGVLLAAGSALGHRRALNGLFLTNPFPCLADGDAQELQSLLAISFRLTDECQQNFKVSRAAVRGTQCDYNLTSSSRCVAPCLKILLPIDWVPACVSGQAQSYVPRS